MSLHLAVSVSVNGVRELALLPEHHEGLAQSQRNWRSNHKSSSIQACDLVHSQPSASTPTATATSNQQQQ
jgi:hypothetical protein